MSAAILLELREVEKGYPGRAEPVLTRVSFAIREGEFTAVAGCSGAGKTTLVSLAAGLLAPDRGEILFGGSRVAGPGPERAVVFQNYSLLPWLTALENVLLAVEATLPALGKDAAVVKAEKYLELVRLGAAFGKRPRELSGGMRQRVALARALAMEPRLLLLDEPLSALDALTRSALQEELARISAESRTTVVMVTNDIDEALFLADRVLPMTRGPAATLGEPIEVPIGRPRARARFTHSPEYQQVRRAILSVLGSTTARTPAASTEHGAPAGASAPLAAWTSG